MVTCEVLITQSLMKVEMKINEISSKVFQRLRVNFLSTNELEKNIGR